MTALKFRYRVFDGALHDERYVASDAAERLFSFFQDTCGRPGRAEIGLGFERNDVLGTSCLAQSALHARVFNEAHGGTVTRIDTQVAVAQIGRREQRRPAGKIKNDIAVRLGAIA